MRITAACPEALIADANQLAMCLGRAPADAYTYGAPRWYDADGNAYAAASWETTPAWVEWALSGLARPAWDVNQIIDMDAAARAQAALVFLAEPTSATPHDLTAFAHPDGREALRLMGLSDLEIPA